MLTGGAECATVPGTSHGPNPEDLPVSIIPDLELDERFPPHVRDRDKTRRFYVGVPIRSPTGMNIGVYCVTDEQPRPGGLSMEQVQFVRDISRTVMDYLEAKRSSEWYRRGERMVRGLGSFVEGQATLSNWTAGLGGKSSLLGDLPGVQEGMLNKRLREGEPRQGGERGPESEGVEVVEKGSGKLLDMKVTRGREPADPFLGGKQQQRQQDHAPPATQQQQQRNPKSTPADQLQADVERVFSKASNVIRESIEVEGVIFVDASVRSFGALIGQQVSEPPILTKACTTAAPAPPSPSLPRPLRVRPSLPRVRTDLAENPPSNGTDSGALQTHVHQQQPVRAFPPPLVFIPDRGHENENGECSSSNEYLPSLTNTDTEGEEDRNRPCRVLGFSTSDGSSITGDGVSIPPVGGKLVLGERLLRRLLARYHYGHIFNFEEDGSVLDQPSGYSPDYEGFGEDESFPSTPWVTTGVSGCSAGGSQGDQRREYFAPGDELKGGASVLATMQTLKRRNLASALQRVFVGAKSVAFLPLFDGTKNRWFAGGFVWTKTPTRIFTVENELSYLRVFGLTTMAEVGRLHAKAAEKAKTDILGSISHELRSPLHGVVGAVEMLRHTTLDQAQENILRTIDTSGRTLLDTIEHVGFSIHIPTPNTHIYHPRVP